LWVTVDGSARPHWAVIAARVLAGIVGAASGGVWLFCLFLVISSNLTSDPAYDPHGFGLMFGFVFAFVSGMVTAIALPLAVAPRLRSSITRIAWTVFAISSIGLLVAPQIF
jgi:hypothetical protein